MAENPSRLKLGALLLPLPLVLLLFYVLPFAGVVGWSVSLPTPGLEQYQRIASDPASTRCSGGPSACAPR
jgi:putative spermidine/putrescine transport system permease protein